MSIVRKIKKWWTKPARDVHDIHDTLDFIGWIVSQTWVKTGIIMNDFSALQAQLEVADQRADALDAKVVEANITLLGLAEAVAGLRGDLARTDVQAQIDVLKERASAVVEKLTKSTASLAAAEDQADDQLPAVAQPALGPAPAVPAEGAGDVVAVDGVVPVPAPVADAVPAPVADATIQG